MKLYQFIAATANPYDSILVFDEKNHILYDLFDFVNDSLKKGFSYNKIFNSFVDNICVNGEFIQCEVEL